MGGRGGGHLPADPPPPLHHAGRLWEWIKTSRRWAAILKGYYVVLVHASAAAGAPPINMTPPKHALGNFVIDKFRDRKLRDRNVSR